MTKPSIGQAPGKAHEVEQMFDDIAPRYDLLNRVLSFGIDVRWRKRAVRMLGESLNGKPDRLLDVATGTADLAIELLRLEPQEVIGVDISAGMLEHGRKKIADKNLENRIRLLQGDAANLPVEDASCDGAIVGFGVRNFEDLIGGLSGIRMALRPGAPLVVLEFSHPRTFPVKQGYAFYSKHVMPRIGRRVSGSNEAYEYLPESVAAFPDGDDFLQIMEKSGFHDCAAKPLTFGVATLYRGNASIHND